MVGSTEPTLSLLAFTTENNTHGKVARPLLPVSIEPTLPVHANTVIIIIIFIIIILNNVLQFFREQRRFSSLSITLQKSHVMQA